MRPHDGRAIPTFLRQALQDRPITVFGDGSQTRSLLLRRRPDPGHHRAGRVRLPPPGQHRQPRRVHAARAGRGRHRGHRLEVGDRLRGAAHGRPAGAPARHRAGARGAGLGARGRAARGPAADDRRGRASRRSSAPARTDRTRHDVRPKPRRCSELETHGRHDDGASRIAASASAERRRGDAPYVAHADRRPARARRAPQAPAGAVLPAAHGHAAARRARRLAAGARLRRVFLAIFTALALKAAVRGELEPRRVVPADEGLSSSFALPASRCCCSRAPGSTPTAPQRPGLTRIVASLFQVDGRRAHLRAGQRQGVLELLHLLRLAVLRASPTSRVPLRLYERLDGRAAARGRLPAPRACSSARGEHIEDVGPRARRRRALADRRRRLHLADAAARQRAALARARSTSSPTCSASTASTR